MAPGIIDTPMRSAAMRQGGIEPGSIDLSMKTSLGYEVYAWDIARAAPFLVGPDGRDITGVLLPSTEARPLARTDRRRRVREL